MVITLLLLWYAWPIFAVLFFMLFLLMVGITDKMLGMFGIGDKIVAYLETTHKSSLKK